jgi:glycosyltransferase involved in cell wall biosynthesis
MIDEVTHKPLEDWQISYVPHGINSKVFKPLDEVSDDIKKLMFGDKEYDFVLFYNNRNIRRKQPSDVIYSYKLFCDKLPKEQSDKCLLLMHTAAVDENGTDLPAVIEALCPYDVKFTGLKLEQDKLNEIYNLVDCTINIANNEGFGLTTAESLMAGTPIIVNVTGGLQDQCGFNYSADDYITFGTLHDKKTHGSTLHGEWVLPIWPSAINLNGSVPTPYIFDDRVNDDEVANKIATVYSWNKEERKRRGLLGREFMIENLSSDIMNNSLIEGIERVFENYKPRERFELYKIV